MVEGSKAPWSAATSPVLGDCDWSPTPCAASGGRPWMYLSWYPIKDPQARHTKSPIPVVRRHDGYPGADPACAYDALHGLFERRKREAGAGWEKAPIFVHPATGAVYSTKDARRVAKAMARASGMPADLAGASAFRIGSATAVYHAYGEAGRRVLHERGRWASDIAFIYARLTETAALEAARRITEPHGRTVEAATGRAQQR